MQKKPFSLEEKNHETNSEQIHNSDKVLVPKLWGWLWISID